MFDFGLKGTKWTLFTTSVDLFAAKGYSNVSIRDIAEAVGIKAASIYNHFGSKEDILITIYDFYNYYYQYFMPTLESLVDYIGKEPPKQTMFRTLFRFDPSIQDIMDKIVLIASMQIYSDERAEDLVFGNMFELSEKRISTILNTMIERGLIEPLDIDAFVLTISSLCHSASLRMRTNHPISWETWVRSVEMLFDQIKEI